MDISNRIPKAAEVNQTSQTEQASESQTTSPEAAESSGGITEVTDQIRPGNALNPYAQLFESPTLNPQALPVEALPITQGGTIIPDSLASVDPQQNLPENLQPQSFNLPGIDTKIAPDHFGIGLLAGGRDGLSSILGFGGSEGLQTTGLNMFAGGRDWSLVSGTTSTNTGDDKNGSTVTHGFTKDGTGVDSKLTWTTNKDGSKSYTFEATITYPDQLGSEHITGSGSEKGSASAYKTVTTTYDENGKVVGRKEELIVNGGAGGTATQDGTYTYYFDANGKLQSYSVKSKDGVTTNYDNQGNVTGKTDKDGNPINEPETGDEYMDPEGGPAVQINVDPNNFLRIQNIRRDLNIMPSNSGTVNTTPSNVDDPQPINIDPKRVYDPRLEKPLVTDGNPEYESQVLFGDVSSIDVSNEAKGGDPVNPNDPDLAPPAPPTKPPE
jgi:Uncharacterized protein conserved in bacteria